MKKTKIKVKRINELQSRYRELKNEYSMLKTHCEDNDDESEHYHNDELNGLWNRIQEIEWVLGINYGKNHKLC